MDSGSLIVITLAFVAVFLVFPGAVAVRMLRNCYSGWTVAVLVSMLFMLGPMVSVVALIATTSLHSSRVAAEGATPTRSVPPPNPFRSPEWSGVANTSGATCGRCGKSMHEPTRGATEVLLGSLLSFSDSLEYPCKSCGQVYCLDCMTAIKVSGLCPKCGRSIGW